MSDEIDKKQRLLIEYIFSNRILFIKCIRIMKPEYFDKPLDRVVEYFIEHFRKYNDIAKFDVVEAETDMVLKWREVDDADFEYVCDEVEKHCREQAMMNAIYEGVDQINEGNVESLEGLVRSALMVKLDNSLGTDLFESPQDRIIAMDAEKDFRKTTIQALDGIIGNIGRGELGIVCAVSGGGKSLWLANIGFQLARQQLDVVYISLELDEGLYSKRLDGIVTNCSIKNHKDDAELIANALETAKVGSGSIITKRMPNGTTASQIRTYLMEYKVQFGKFPDAVFVDYMAGMGLDGIKSTISLNKYDVDKEKSEALREIASDCWLYMFTAAQINRDGQDVYDGINPSHVQGGISMIQTSDWTVAILQNVEDIDNNQFKLAEMKLRNEAKTGKMGTAYLNPLSLRISNNPVTTTNKGPTKKLQTTSKKAPVKTSTGKTTAPKKMAPSEPDPKSKVKKALKSL